MSKKGGLGTGFSSLFEDNLTVSGSGGQTLRISEIEPNKNQPRTSFDKEALEALADSIRANGVLQPILVRPLPNGNYQIVAGERRWRASKMAGLDEVPVLIKDLSDIETKQIALIENLQREDLNPLEIAAGYKDLIDKYSMTQDEVSKVVNKSRSGIANALRLLSLPEPVKRMVTDNELTIGHCKALLSLQDEKLMIEAAKRIVAGELTVRQVEKLSKHGDKNRKEKIRKNRKDTYFTEVELSLSEAMGKKVTIQQGAKKNVLEIEFHSNEELNEMVNALAGKKIRTKPQPTKP